MDNQQLYEDAICRLHEQDYEVCPDERGYVVRHLVDGDDVSRMRDLDDLIEFADLMDWAAARRRSAKSQSASTLA